MCWTSQPTVRSQVMTEIGQWMCDCFLQQWNCNLWDDWQRERAEICWGLIRSSSKSSIYLEPYLFQLKDTTARSLCFHWISHHPYRLIKGAIIGHARLIPAEQWYPTWKWERRYHFLIVTHLLCDVFESAAANHLSFSSLGAEQQFVLMASSMTPCS